MSILIYMLCVAAPAAIAFLTARTYVRYGSKETLLLIQLMVAWVFVEGIAQDWISENPVVPNYVPSLGAIGIWMAIFSFAAFCFGVTEEKSNPPRPTLSAR